MKGIVAALAAERGVMVVAAVLLATPAAAQNAAWLDPTGTWSMDFTSVGWGQGGRLPGNARVLLFAPRLAPTENEVRICLVEQQATAAGPDARARAGAFGVEEVQRIFSRDISQAQVTHQAVNGVAVAFVDGVSNGRRFRGRIFVTSVADRSILSKIACVSTLGMPAAREAEVDAVLNSIHFHNPDQRE